jgi:hypothetical protein
VLLLVQFYTASSCILFPRASFFVRVYVQIGGFWCRFHSFINFFRPLDSCGALVVVHLKTFWSSVEVESEVKCDGDRVEVFFGDFRGMGSVA